MRSGVLSSRVGEPVRAYNVKYDSLDCEMDVLSFSWVLSNRDMDTFRGIRNLKRARQFLWGRVLFAYVMRCQLGIRDALLYVGPKGRPHIAYARSRRCLDVNLSHCNGHVTMAGSSLGKVGIDAETHRSDVDGIARRFFSEREVAWLSGLDTTARSVAFSRLWTVKEACAKTSGVGLKPPLMTVDVPLRRSGSWSAGKWWNIPMGASVSCAVAIAHPRLSMDIAPLNIRLDRAQVLEALGSTSR